MRDYMAMRGILEIAAKAERELSYNDLRPASQNM